MTAPVTDRDTYSTFEAAKLCRCSHRTIIRLFDSGQLQGYRLPPDKKYRRILRSSLDAYLAAHGMPAARLGPNGRPIIDSM